MTVLDYGEEMPGNIAAIAMVKDECDIIELFVKINSRAVDHIYIIDHNSRDGTTEILVAMKNAGYPVTVYRYESTNFQQALVLTNLARQVAATDDFEYIIPLDADEFIPCTKAEFLATLRSELKTDTCGTLKWLTFGPTSADYAQSSSPLFDLFRQRTTETNQRYKVVIPNAVAKHCIISEGNHSVKASAESDWMQGKELSIPLQHAPVRSFEQITAKALLGSMTLSIKPHRLPDEGAHWDELTDKLVSNNYQMAFEQLTEFVDFYAGLPKPGEPLYSDENRIGLPSDKIELINESRINLTKKLHQFGQRLCAALTENESNTKN